MKVGLDSFTIRELGLDPFEQLRYARDHGFEGLQFHDINDVSSTLDAARLKDLYQCAGSYGIYCHMSLGMTLFPLHRKRGTRETLDAMTREIEMCAASGWHELRAVLGGVDERFGPDARWGEHRQSCIELLKAVVPVLKANQSRINLEDHGDLSTFELVEIVEEVGPDVVGVNLDTANVLLFAEDPVMAAGRVAPYTHLTHAKDGILFFTDGGVTRQGRPPGGGVVDWPGVLEVLAEHNPEMPISIEDHKWLFEVKIFENAWHEAHGRVSTYELSQFVRLAAEGSRKLMTGELPDAAQYESIPFVEQMGDRLSQGRTYLQGLVAELGLR